VYVRDLQISDFTNWPSSPLLKEMAGKWGPPELSQSYVGAMEMTAGIRLLQYLEKEGQQVRLTESRRFPAESFAAQNTIFLGMPRTAGYLKQMLDKTNFYIAKSAPTSYGTASRARRTGGLSGKYPTRPTGGSAPAIITLLPRAPSGPACSCSWDEISNLTSVLLSLEGLKILDEQWRKTGSPDAGKW
jgi:hypothetical protein